MCVSPEEAGSSGMPLLPSSVGAPLHGRAWDSVCVTGVEHKRMHAVRESDRTRAQERTCAKFVWGT